MSKKSLLIVSIVVIIVVGVGSFYAGMQYGKSSGSKNLRAGFNPANMDRAGRLGAAAGSGFINGEIIAKDQNSVTLQLREAGSKIIFFSTSTQISKFVQGEINDLSIGQTVMVSGKQSSDGTLSAQTIQLRPSLPESTGF